MLLILIFNFLNAGDKYGAKGFYVMNDNWFDQHMFEVAVPKTLLTEDQRRALETPTIELPPWDPSMNFLRVPFPAHCSNIRGTVGALAREEGFAHA